MNVLLWVLQVLLALHTVTGAVWKFTSSEQTVPSLSALPHAAWLGLSVVELACGVALILPALAPRLRIAAPIAASFIVAEMLLFCGVHLSSGNTDHGELIYWLVVAALSAFVAWGRFVQKPIAKKG